MYFHFKPSSDYVGMNRGFGLVELLVGIGIMMLVTSVILVKNSAFNGAVLLRNQAYEVAFALRQAQLLAVSGNEAGATDTVHQYGVYFSRTTGQEQSYSIFHDINHDGKFDSGEAVGVAGKLDPRFEIRDFTTEAEKTQNIDELTVVFKRPDFDARFYKNSSTRITSSSNIPMYIDISRMGQTSKKVIDVRRVEITGTGQISVVPYE